MFAAVEIFGRYQLLTKLATGGMAQIYLARELEEPSVEKLFVVKRLLPHLAINRDFVAMFLEEGRIAAQLSHPNIARILDVGQVGDSFFIAMEYVHGEDLRRVLRQAEVLKVPIPIPLACRVVIEACSALDFAHTKNSAAGQGLKIVHRDMSPQNILVSFEGQVKVADFGIAKAADQATVTQDGILKGKYSYMSPEQTQGEPVDARTDVFAMGIVLYELLTQARLFKRPTDLETLNAVAACRVEAPSRVDQRVPRELDAIVMNALAREREVRTPTAAALKGALEGWLRQRGGWEESLALGSFMQQLYAPRLKDEAEKGVFASAMQGSEWTVEPPLETREVATPGPSDAVKQKRARKLGALQRSLKGPFWVLAVVLAATAVLGVYALVRPAMLTMVVTSKPPGASVWVDGLAVECVTPCRLPRVSSGQHEVAVKKAGYRQVVGTVVLPSSGEVSVSYELRQEGQVEKVVLEVVSSPPGARVSVNGETRGVAPLEVTVSPGPVTIGVELDGHQGLTEKMELSGQQERVVRTFVLKPE